ncbi:hypothetical protein MRS76_05140 [Rhizobiaceae bacterium n13]|uniref:Uncharacterized protein n=1 Tax=Ferirhizobium litorale TaxID=2927786 RepID=A0AAE3QCM8_9HYPH|nr:hypothetical protein [Fererhizobium litorale]MDI7861333.1 hypothetical protein [Fererhizobium litorale]MDI7921480.1 hypothetical protein [Fererhizobium litorale]
MTYSSSSQHDASDVQDPKVVRILDPVDIQGLTQFTENGVMRGIGSAVISARWNFVARVRVPGVTFRSNVMASIAELFQNPEDGGAFSKPDIGPAHMYVRAVAPKRDEVWVSGYIDWERNLPVRVSVFIGF